MEISLWLIEAITGLRSRIIVEIHPRSGKSELISHWFPVYFLNQFPSKNIILTSYEADFAASWGRKTRNSILEHSDQLNVNISTDSSAAHRWHTTAGGGMMTAGVGGPITGKGADVLICDDPVKNRLAVDTPVPTPSGWSTIGTLRPGDQIFDDCGRVIVVKSVSPVTTPDKCYELSFNDRTAIVASYDHPWVTHMMSPCGVGIRTTEEIYDTQRMYGKTNHSIPIVAGLQLPKTDLPVPPYLLGAWLGDGDSKSPRITTGTTDSHEIATEIRSEGVIVDIKGPYSANPNVHVLALRLSPKGSHLSPLKGLYGNKHIPLVYLRASYTQRLSLLQGLLDTDGSADTSGGVTLCLKNERLAKGACELMRTLGWKPRFKEYLRWHGSVFCVSGTPPRGQQVFRLGRKQARLGTLPAKRSRQARRYITSVRLVPKQPCCCISVSNDSRLYLVGEGFIQTHNSEEANSPVYRAKTKEWWDTTAYTRLEPGGIVVIVGTRWHEDDLIGQLIKEMEQGGEKWDVLSLPAIADEDEEYTYLKRKKGDPLWPYRYDLGPLERIKKAISIYHWSALYQQRPLPRGGAMFKREWFPLLKEPPADVSCVRFWDLAATEARPGSDPDWTVGLKMGRTKENKYIIFDIVRLRGTPHAVEKVILQTATADGPDVRIYVEQEGGASGVTVLDHYVREVLKDFFCEGRKPTSSKELRATPFSSAAEAGNIEIVNGPWVGAYLSELESFPRGSHDDQVDTSSGAYSILEERGGGFDEFLKV